ncbi:serine-protein kinase ATM [Nematocida homosporus]|uniref:serine-protein kinase ATM n=1 Tax=Nematocida homosporus TaxID=1912981 RepID=UPI002220C758|nr:serine-protein kinase ATM [Nematocida homosporus]KAI5186852.1 serine-protein kinase ATM [Nematocida homosporus]
MSKRNTLSWFLKEQYWEDLSINEKIEASIACCRSGLGFDGRCMLIREIATTIKRELEGIMANLKFQDLENDGSQSNMTKSGQSMIYDRMKVEEYIGRLASWADATVLKYSYKIVCSPDTALGLVLICLEIIKTGVALVEVGLDVGLVLGLASPFLGLAASLCHLVEGRVSLGLMQEVARLWREYKGSEVRQIGLNIERIGYVLLQDKEIKIMPFLVELMRIRHLSGLHKLFIYALEGEIDELDGLFELFRIFGPDELVDSMLQVCIEDACTFDLYLVVFMYLYYSGQDYSRLLLWLVHWCTDQKYSLTLQSSEKDSNEKRALCILTRMLYLSDGVVEIEKEELYWSTRSLLVILHRTYSEKDVIRAMQCGTDESLFFFHAVVLINRQVTLKHLCVSFVLANLAKMPICLYIALLFDLPIETTFANSKEQVLYLVCRNKKEELKAHIPQFISDGLLGFSTFLEKSLPVVELYFPIFYSVRKIDIGQAFVFPEKWRILPTRSIDKDILAPGRWMNDDRKNLAWMLFLETTTNLLAGTKVAYTTNYSLELLLRAPRITRAVCASSFPTREEHILQLCLETTNRSQQLTQYERLNLHSAIYTIGCQTQNPSLQSDIFAYLKKNLSFLEYHALVRPGPNSSRPANLLAQLIQDALPVCTPIRQQVDSIPKRIQKKIDYFAKAATLSPRNLFILKTYFKLNYLSYDLLKSTTDRYFSPTSKLAQLLPIYYNDSLEETIPGPPLAPNSLLYIIDAFMRSLFPEKVFFYRFLCRALGHTQALTQLEVCALIQALEYAHAYRRKWFGWLHLLFNEYTVEFTRSRHVLKFQRLGPFCRVKQMIALAKCQQNLFTAHYNTTNPEKSTAAYFADLIPVTSSIKVLLYLEQMPKPPHKLLAELPCQSSVSFIELFYSHDAKVFATFTPDYADFAQFYTTSLHHAGLCPARYTQSDPFLLFSSRHQDNGVLAKPLYKTEEPPLPSVEELLEAATKLEQWSEALDKTEAMHFILANSLIISGRSDNRYIDFLLVDGPSQRYKFLRSLNPTGVSGRTYNGSDQIEEALHMCTLPPHRLIFALDERRVLNSSALCLTVSALEHKWLNKSAEAFLSGNSNCQPIIADIIAPHYTNPTRVESCTNPSQKPTTLDELNNLPCSASSDTTNLAIYLLLLKIEERILPSPNQLQLLERVQGYLEARTKNSQKDPTALLYAKAVSIHTLYMAQECNKPPKHVLNNYIEKATTANFGFYHYNVFCSLAKACLFIFNSQTIHRSVKNKKPKPDGPTKHKFVQKEETVVRELEEERTKEVTEIETKARTLGLKLLIRVAEFHNNLQNLVGLIHLLFSEKHQQDKIDPNCLNDIDIRSFFPLKQQIISYYYHLLSVAKKATLTQTLKLLLMRMLETAPHRVAYDILIRESPQAHDKFVSLIPPEIRRDIKQVVREYHLILRQAQAAIPITASFPPKTPVLTSSIDKFTKDPIIQQVLPKSKQLKGINKPVRIKILASNGLIYQEILKLNDELRQDILSTQVFHYMNTILDNSTGTSIFGPRIRTSCTTPIIESRIRTYNIVALERFFGVLAFIPNAEPLGTTIDQLRNLSTKPALTHSECRKTMEDSLNLPLSERTAIFLKVLKLHPPVLKYTFDGPGPFEYFKQRKTFTHSFSINAIATYVLGLGDRHPHNILLDKTTKECINIDLNLIFDQARLLSTPERVPFRMTQNIEQALLAYTTHTHQNAMAAFFAALKETKESFLVFISIIQVEPLYRWQVIRTISRTPRLFSDYQSILARLQDKLNGTEDGFTQSNTAHIQALILKATDPSRLAQIYPGWSPWI